MDSKMIGIIVAVALIAGGGGYYVGSSANKSAASNRGQFSGQFASRAGAGANARVGGGAAFGTIVSKDANSITVQLTGGPNASSTNGSATGSKLVLVSPQTEISKSVAGSASDLSVGTDVVVNGTANSDGSISAQMIQLRPAGAPGPYIRQGGGK